MIKFKAKFTSIGPMVSEFINHNILVIFGESAPEELAEFAVLHDGKELLEPVAVGDTVSIDGEKFEVLAVGNIANVNLENLGHLVLKCNGKTIPDMPGDVCLESKPLPPINVDGTLEISG